MDIDERLYSLILPTFTLQPLVENAIKHGTSNMFEEGNITIKAYLSHAHVILEVIDNAGLYVEQESNDGLGTAIVDKRLKNQFGDAFGLSMSCIENQQTKATIYLPLESIIHA
jgi:two-component system LytT family sensor kinase